MRPKATPLSPLRNRFITFYAAQRSNQGLVHHLAGQQQRFTRPALDQVPIGHAARVRGLVGGGVYLAKASACTMAAPDSDLLSGLRRHHATYCAQCAHQTPEAGMPRTHTATLPSRKRPVNLTLSESLVADPKGYTSNLSATAEELLAAYVQEQKQKQASRQQQADQSVAGWNALHAQAGSFADEHSTL